MPTERTPLRQGENVPPYVFITNHNRAYKNKIRRFQCCICAGLLAIFITALVITVSYSVNHDSADENITTEALLSPVSNNTLLTLLTLSWPLQDKPYPEWTDVPNDTEIEGAVAEGRKALNLKEVFEEKVPSLLVDSPSYRHQMATRTMPAARELSKAGFIMEGATKELAKRRSSSKGKLVGRGPQLRMEWLPAEVCRPTAKIPCSSSPYRSADGTCNNLIHPRTWGVAMRPFRRVLPPDYADGISAPRKAKDGSVLPSARHVSLTVHRPLYRDDPNFTVMLAVWGQFIDHDITATALSQGKGGSAISCCNGYFQSGVKAHPECYTVTLYAPDPYFKDYNVSCMEFVRSSPAPVCSFGPREQMNQATSFLDGSVVYGISENLMNELRTFQGGELKMLITSDGRELLPVSTDSNDGCNQEEQLKNGRYCFLSGDPRSNENIHLTTIHLLFARQHNKIARNLAKINPSWDDERLFQESRKIVTAQIQHITYNEFLPVILGPQLMEKLKMTPRKDKYSDTYDSALDPTIANSFAASAFRFGHTLLPGLVRMIAGDNSSEEYVEMHKLLFNPFQIYDKGFLEKAVRGALNTPVEKSDTYFNEEFTQHLFEAKRKPSVGRPAGMCGLDLVSLNVQRGRDHGLPGYPAFREHCGLSRPKTFEDLEPYLDSGSLDRIKQIYKQVDDIDMYTGALAEFPLEGSLVGPTVTCLITDQFLRIQRGDRYWYETSEKPQAFTSDQLRSIRQTTLAKIICETSNVKRVQPMVMRKVSADNDHSDCSDLPDIDYNAWQDGGNGHVSVNDGSGKIWLIRSSAPKSPRVVKVGGVVTSGSVMVEGVNIWSGTLPVRIPVHPLDTVSQNLDSPSVAYPPVFSHGILWLGSVEGTENSARIDGRLSFPQYVHKTDGNVSVKWYNGGFSFQLNLEWNSTGEDNLSLQGQYTTPLYFHNDKNLYLSNSSASNVVPVSSSSDFPELDNNNNVAPLILTGIYSPDREWFLWSGNFTFIIPLPQSTPPPTPNLLQLAYTPKTYIKRVKLGGRVIGASISAQGYNVWSGALPLTIPVDPFDTVAGTDDAMSDEPLVYGHGINWRGSILSSLSKTATLSGSFSLPRFVHSNGIAPFAINWFNGDFTADLDVAWWSSCNELLNFEGVYTTQVYFGERKQYEYLKNVSQSSFDNLNIGFAGTPKQYEEGLKAPLILLGTYSNDRKSFYWSGNFTLVLPQTVPIPTQAVATTLEKVTTTKGDRRRLPLRLVGGQVNLGGWNIWYNNLPLGIPIKPFDSVASPDNGDEPEDRPIVYGHGILWNGSVSTIDSNYVKLHGTFSFPNFLHSGGLSNNFSLSWLNGDFDLQFQSNVTFSMSGTFTTSVYFASQPEFEALKDITVNRIGDLKGLGLLKTNTPKVLYGNPETYTSAPLILFGAYSLDRQEFLWSGKCILIAPVTQPEIVTTMVQAKVSEGNSFKIGGTVTKVDIFVEGVKVSEPAKPPFSIPTAIFDSVSTSLSSANQPPAYAQGLLWSGQLTNKPSKLQTFSITGVFSLPSVINDTVFWYNGNFTIDIDVAWKSSNSTVSGTFSSPIFFNSKKSKKTGVQATQPIKFSPSITPLVTPDVTESAPIILTGEFSSDNEAFLWSGEITIITPVNPKLMLAETPTTSIRRLSVSAFVNGGSITVAGTKVWVGNRLPLVLPAQPFDSVMSISDNVIYNPPTYGHGISWQGYIASDAPGTIKTWGAYSAPQFIHSDNSQQLQIDWYNGDFAFDLKLLWDQTTNVKFNGSYITAIYFQERTSYPEPIPEWNWSLDQLKPINVPLISPNNTKSFIPLILHGKYTADKTKFIWSGNVTFVVENEEDY